VEKAATSTGGCTTMAIRANVTNTEFLTSAGTNCFENSGKTMNATDSLVMDSANSRTPLEKLSNSSS